MFDYKDGEQIKNDFIERQTKEIAELEKIPEAQRTEEQNELLAEMKDTLEKVQSGELKVNGDVTSDGITINLDSPKAFFRTTGHEISHLLEKSKAYEDLKDTLFKYAKGKGVDIDGELLKISAKYQGVQNANPEAELVADLVGDYLFTDYDFVKHLSPNHSLFQKAYDGIKYLCKIATAGSKEARELEKVKKTFEELYRESRAEKNTADEVNYSVTSKMTEEERYTELKSKQIEITVETDTLNHLEAISSLDNLEKKIKSQAEKIIYPLAEKLGITIKELTHDNIDVEFIFFKNKRVKRKLKQTASIWW